MGEYARRKSDGQEIKIGTCENVYYLRFEDIDKVDPIAGSTDITNEHIGHRFRLPLPEEDEILPGEYDPCFKCVPLSTAIVVGDDGEDEIITFQIHPDAADHPGNIQVKHDCGLLLNVPCHHGLKLPEIEGVNVFWNGKTKHWWKLESLKSVKGGLLPVVTCTHCGTSFCVTWCEVLDFINDPKLKERLRWVAIRYNPENYPI